MAERDYFSHTVKGTTHNVFWYMQHEYGYCFKLAGENIGTVDLAGATEAEATSWIFDQFMNSAGHRANILGKAWDVVAVGAYRTTGDTFVWTACSRIRARRLPRRRRSRPRSRPTGPRPGPRRGRRATADAASPAAHPTPQPDAEADPDADAASQRRPRSPTPEPAAEPRRRCRRRSRPEPTPAVARAAAEPTPGPSPDGPAARPWPCRPAASASWMRRPTGPSSTRS